MKRSDNMEKDYKITWKKFWGHLHTVNSHRLKVFRLCCKVGIPIQGLLHDLSKYSRIEFWEGVKYYQGDYSPIHNCKKENGYSEAWLHHKGRNKHHYEYWYDYESTNETPPMPFKYFLEMICDTLSAGMTYQGKDWTKEYQLSYWTRTKERVRMNEAQKIALEKVYKEIAKKGIKEVLNKKAIKKIYDETMKKEEKLAKKEKI